MLNMFASVFVCVCVCNVEQLERLRIRSAMLKLLLLVGFQIVEFHNGDGPFGWFVCR